MRAGIIAAVVGAVTGGALGTFAIYAASAYGVMLFIALPVVVGFVTGVTLYGIGGPARLRRVQLWTTVASLLLAAAFLLFAIEGVICLVVAMPLWLPLVWFGGALAYGLFHDGQLPYAGAAGVIAIAATATLMTIEARSLKPSRVFVAADSIIIHAPAVDVWSAIVALDEIAPSRDLVFRAGIAQPRTTRIVTCASGGLRICTLSTGTLIERIDTWEPNRRLAWRALTTPPPMKELNPFGDADPPHLHGAYQNVRGEFAIERVAPRVTRLTRRTWYALEMYPAYWRIWCDSARRRSTGSCSTRSAAARSGTREAYALTATPKAEETRTRILDGALRLFRDRGFDQTTMRDVASEAGVATGAAYYYFRSKEELVMAFYLRTSEESRDQFEAALAKTKDLRRRIGAMIDIKFEQFTKNRELLTALLRAGVDPRDRLSPFGPATKEVRDETIRWYERALDGSNVTAPKDLAPYLPRLLWLYHMGLIYYWIIDESPGQRRTHRLTETSLDLIVQLLRFASLPLMGPVRKRVLAVLRAVEDQ